MTLIECDETYAVTNAQYQVANEMRFCRECDSQEHRWKLCVKLWDSFLASNGVEG